MILFILQIFISKTLCALEFKKTNECTISSSLKKKIKGVCIIEGEQSHGELDTKLTLPDGKTYHLEKYIIEKKHGEEVEKYLIDNKKVIHTKNDCLIKSDKIRICMGKEISDECLSCTH